MLRWLLLATLLIQTASYSIRCPPPRTAAVASAARSPPVLLSEETTIESPFADSSTDATPREKLVGPLDLSEENVELVLDELRPFLISDGGNVELRDIDGGVVVLELIGACGTCPSSSMTMKMGLEKGLMDLIPEILAVEQVARDGAAISEEGISEVLEEIRPFLKLCGGDVELLSVDAGDVQPSCTLRLTGSSATLRSVKGEIIQRLRDKMPTLAGVLWEE